MFPSNSRQGNTQQYVQRAHFPSIIRTRSQQQYPLAPVDMYASPLKEAMKNHSQNHTKHTQDNCLPADTLVPTFSDKGKGIAAEDSLVPYQRKRSSSPLSSAEKRLKVLGQSNRVNFFVHQHPKDSLASPSKTAQQITPLTPTSQGLVLKATPVMDLIKVARSPPKPGSPSKTLRITMGGLTMTVPVTPSKKGADFKPSQSNIPIATQSHPRDTPSHSTNNLSQISIDISSEQAMWESASSPKIIPDIGTSRNTHIEHTISVSKTPVHDATTNCSSNPISSLPYALSAKRSHQQDFSALPFSSPTKTTFSPSKSRIPVSATRIPKPSIFPDVSILPEVSLPSPVKLLSKHVSPARSKIRAKSKVKSGSRGKIPLTRQAVRKGLRRLSSVKDLKAVIPPKNNAEGVATSSTSLPLQSKLSERPTQREIPKTSRKDSKSSALKKTAIFSVPPLGTGHTRTSTSNSPNKPTPLVALSTALQKLEKTPPPAPTSRPRPSTSLGFSRPHCSEALPVISIFTCNAPERSPQTPHLFRPDSQTTLGHDDFISPNKAVNKTSLLARHPTAADLAGRTVTKNGVGPFASKKTTLSTVAASPTKSVTSITPPSTQMSRKKDGLSVQHAVFDVDAWGATGNGRGRGKDEANNSKKIEYFAPLASELSNRALPPPQISPSRRASQASLSLTQSLAIPRSPGTSVPGRSVSLSHLHLNPRTPVKTRGRTKPMPPPPGVSDPMTGKRLNAKMPGSLDVLKDCVIFVDIRTEDGEDSSALFVDMLRGLGARILAKPGKSCTHLVFKAGLPSTITKYKLLPEPRPLVVSIAWVVECAEKRQHIDETKFLVNLDELGEAGSANRRRSMLPKPMRTVTLGQLESGEYADISITADSSFTSEEPSSSLALAHLSPLPARLPNDLPPLERARMRNKSLRLSKE